MLDLASTLIILQKIKTKKADFNIYDQLPVTS